MVAKDKVFFDTNVLVYQFDQTAPAKQKRAQKLIEQHILEERGVISSQVVQEFMNVATKKFKVKISKDELELVMNDVLKPLCQHTPTFDFYERALSVYRYHKTSFYDALVVQAALDLGCKTLYSEDLQPNRNYGSLTIVNPFV